MSMQIPQPPARHGMPQQRPMPTPPIGRAGWYIDGYGANRYWDGQQWTQHVQPPPIPVHAQAVMMQPQARMMVTKSKTQTSHTFHLLMTIFTAGLWGLFVWLPITVIHQFTHDKSVTKVHY